MEAEKNIKKIGIIGYCGQGRVGRAIAEYLALTKEQILHIDTEPTIERGITINKEKLTIDRSHLITKITKLPETRVERRARERKAKRK